MADRSYIASLLNVFDGAEKRSLVKAFEEVTTFTKFGDADEVRSVNFAGTFLTATTSSVANQEASIQHGLGITPYMLMPAMPLNSTLSQMVPLQVSRPADDQYIYLRSTSTGARVTIYLEAAIGYAICGQCALRMILDTWVWWI